MEKVVIDVDGVILNFSLKFCEYYNERNDNKILNNPDDWHYGLQDKKKLGRRIGDFIKTNPILPLLDDNWTSFAENLCKKYDVNIVTAYSNKDNRLNNLKLHGIKYSNIHFTDNTDKIGIVKNLNPKYVFEDNPEHIENLCNVLPNSKIFVPSIWNYVNTYKFSNTSNIMFYQEVNEIDI